MCGPRVNLSLDWRFPFTLLPVTLGPFCTLELSAFRPPSPSFPNYPKSRHIRLYISFIFVDSDSSLNGTFERCWLALADYEVSSFRYLVGSRADTAPEYMENSPDIDVTRWIVECLSHDRVIQRMAVSGTG